jgi:heme/copper-type cytochrome/quinol oxidase subunit 2
VEDYRRHLYEALHAASRDYDQAIITLAGGTLALSVTFAHDITPQPGDGTRNILLTAWAALLLSLVAIVVSFLTSQRVLRMRIAAIDHPGDDALIAARLTVILNWIAGGALIVGLGLLGWYTFANT